MGVCEGMYLEVTEKRVQGTSTERGQSGSKHHSLPPLFYSSDREQRDRFATDFVRKIKEIICILRCISRRSLPRQSL